MNSREEFDQLRFHFTDTIQHDYEVIRPIVLFAQPVTERSKETDIKRTTVSEKARRFVAEGMLGLVDQRQTRSGHKRHQYPESVARYILYNQLTLPFLEEVVEVQKEYPRAGRFRVHGILQQEKGEDTCSEHFATCNSRASSTNTVW